MLKENLPIIDSKNFFIPTSFGFREADSLKWRKNLDSHVMNFTIVDCTDQCMLTKIVDLQECVWNVRPEDRIAVPTNILSIAEDTGGFVLTAQTDQAKEPEGFVLTLGARDNRLLLHMIGVSPEKRYQDLGYNLMVLAASIAEHRGVKEIFWTYDPLMAGNASLYMRKLGGFSEEFEKNKYGTVGGIYGEDPTDRLVVRWQLDDPKTIAKVLNTYHGIPSKTIIDEIPVIPQGLSSEDYPERFLLPIPNTLDGMDSQTKIQWRLKIRSVLSHVLSSYEMNGTHRITNFVSFENGTDRQNYYLVEHR